MRASAPVALCAIGVTLLLAAIGLSFWAGCTGDVKTGALGNPVAALQIESFSAVAALAAALALVGAVSTLRTRASTTRVKLGVAAAFAVAVLWVTVGLEAEVQGVKQCLTARANVSAQRGVFRPLPSLSLLMHFMRSTSEA